MEEMPLAYYLNKQRNKQNTENIYNRRSFITFFRATSDLSPSGIWQGPCQVTWPNSQHIPPPSSTPAILYRTNVFAKHHTSTPQRGHPGSHGQGHMMVNIVVVCKYPTQEVCILNRKQHFEIKRLHRQG